MTLSSPTGEVRGRAGALGRWAPPGWPGGGGQAKGSGPRGPGLGVDVHAHPHARAHTHTLDHHLTVKQHPTITGRKTNIFLKVYNLLPKPVVSTVLPKGLTGLGKETREGVESGTQVGLMEKEIGVEANHS